MVNENELYWSLMVMNNIFQFILSHFSSKLENRHITICWQSFVYSNIICSHSCNVKKAHSHSILFDLDCLKIHQGGKQMAFRDVLALESNIKIGLEPYLQHIKVKWHLRVQNKWHLRVQNVCEIPQGYNMTFLSQASSFCYECYVLKD
jgi:hypothetical protein